MNYQPISEGKNPDILALLCLLAAAVSFASSCLIQSFVWVFQLLLVIFLTVALYVAVRYRLTRYEYRIEPCRGESLGGVSYELAARTLMTRKPETLEFSVWRRKGRQEPMAECRFYLSELIACEHLTGNGRARRKCIRSFGQMRLFPYTVSMDPPSPYLLVFSADGYGKVGVLIEAEETMAAVLSRAVQPREAAEKITT